MTSARVEVKKPAEGIGITDTAEGLGGIEEPGCAAVIWRRQMTPDFHAWIDDLNPAELPKARLILRPTAVPEAVQHVCDIAGMGASAERRWLENDISDLAKLFAKIMQAPYLRVRLDVIETNACRKFHIDAIHARLICTYRGTGTQYGIAVRGEEPKRVFTVATGAPMIMRGTLWPEAPAASMLHRSPPIAGKGETRLVLVLDPIFELDEAE